MKFFTSDWYKSKKPCENSQIYYSYISENYDYYPQWYKDFNCIVTGQFVFHDSMICNKFWKDNDLYLELLGIVPDSKKSFHLIFEDANIVEEPDVVEGMDIVSEELYCSSDCSELHFLLFDDENCSTSNFTVKCKNIQLVYIKEPKLDLLLSFFTNFFNYFKKRNRKLRKIEQSKIQKKMECSQNKLDCNETLILSSYQSFLAKPSENIINILNNNLIDAQYNEYYTDCQSLSEKEKVLTDWINAYENELYNAKNRLELIVKEDNDSIKESIENHINISLSYVESFSVLSDELNDIISKQNENNTFNSLFNSLNFIRNNALHLIECVYIIDGNYLWTK